MGNLFTSLLNSANAVQVLDRQLAVLQNNVTNANTPGFVRQTQSVQAMAFDLSSGLQGGLAAGLDAQMHNALEQLSEYTDVVALKDPDGAINVYLGGQTPLVIGNHQYTLTPEVTPGQAIVRDPSGADVTTNVTSGKLAALVK